MSQLQPQDPSCSVDKLHWRVHPRKSPGSPLVENIYMRKTIIPSVPSILNREPKWLQLNAAAVEVTSEDPDHPVERALDIQTPGGWKAAASGEQRIRIAFDDPVPVRRIHLCFVENTVDRRQEFALHWYDTKGNRRLIVRQQWNFSPGGSTIEVENYAVALEGVTKLELTIQPGSEAGAVATLDCWRIA